MSLLRHAAVTAGLTLVCVPLGSNGQAGDDEEGDVQVFNATGKNEYYQLANGDSIAMGGGGAFAWLVVRATQLAAMLVQ